MPSSFHAEVVLEKDRSYQIYLLDMQFQNSVVINSEVKAYIQNGKKKNNLKCEANEDYFQCKRLKSQKYGTLNIMAKRDGVQTSMNTKYKLPLKSH